eukprot:scaffold113856_cov63-Phaeocystis_antarctica.AAC.1
MSWWSGLFSLALAHNSSGATLAHVQNLTAPGVHGVLHWWCDEQGHAAEPLCVRHEITLQISLAHGTERWQLQQRRHRLAGTSAAADLAGAIAAYCNGSATTQMQRVSGVCKRANAAEESHVPMMEQLCAAPSAPCPHTHDHERCGAAALAQDVHAQLVVLAEWAQPEPELPEARAAAAPSRGRQRHPDGAGQGPARGLAREGGGR